ncbi:Cthe_2314 family HEPN domain-containing protein [Paenibacillus aurantius]|uniref:Cthe_2314 family HEPN domain-containing protein n=1 Tax=Paenibacillus aurantius TaxID=2918900 RepID=A0AA96RGS3_9BACL|nr:Cthe_2314 family HEPN domain-containing protein [Paenibacillus aurantius]WNQ12628.1 Cthe_2314 family HEPN domain-containing protein [Paenibacillus aurantius]
MFRIYFNEERRQDSGVLADANASLKRYEQVLEKIENRSGEADSRLRCLQVWAKGFTRSLDELEQSLYCSRKYSELVSHEFIEEMEEEELDNYHRHVYFYKNALIRLFSILDKMGSFLDDLLKLETGKVMPRFSYFTVLRQMHEREIASELEQKLFDLKNSCKGPLNRLRQQRNTEIHAMNEELVDDVWNAKESPEAQSPVENIQDNLKDMEQGFEMVCLTVSTVFESLASSQKG